MYVYCLFCQTQRCERIARLMEIRGVDRAFSPKIVTKQRKAGKNMNRERDLLPGYVFLFNEERLADFEVFTGIDGIIRRVGRTGTGYELEGEDREFALKLLDRNGSVGILKTVKIGETVRLADSLFDGSEGVITRIDYRKERARVDFRFEGNACHVWVAVEDVSKV